MDEQLLSKLDAIEARSLAGFQRLVAVETKIDSVIGSQNQIAHNLFGNGKVGLLVQVDRLEQQAKRQRALMKWVGGTMGTVLAAVATGVAKLLF